MENNEQSAAPGMQPTQPIQPMQPAQPVEPMQPVQPVQPAQPVQPIEPAQPTQPVQPTGPTEPMQALGNQAMPTEPTQPMQQPTQPTQPTQPVQPIEPVQPTQPAGSMQTLETQTMPTESANTMAGAADQPFPTGVATEVPAQPIPTGVENQSFPPSENQLTATPGAPATQNMTATPGIAATPGAPATPTTPATMPTSSSHHKKQNKFQKIIEKIKEFFKKPANIALAVILVVVLGAVIVVGIISATSGNKKQNTTNPSESSKAASETDTSESNKTDQANSTNENETLGSQTVECAGKNDFLSLKNKYEFENGELEKYSMTISLDKIDQSTLSEENSRLYSTYSSLSNNLAKIKDTKAEGVNINISDTDASTYTRMLAERGKITDEELKDSLFSLYDGLTAEDIAKTFSGGSNETIEIKCEIN